MKSIIFTQHIPDIIAGTKTQDRRTYGLEAVNQNPDEWEFVQDWTEEEEDDTFYAGFKRIGYLDSWAMCKSRYKAGDLVYVKEGYQLHDSGILYKADDAAMHIDSGWKSPAIMPQWASRLTFRILEVKAPERVKSISEADALSEGGWTYNKCPIHKAPEKSLFQLWDSINAKRGLGTDKNPWVWPYVFEVVK